MPSGRLDTESSSGEHESDDQKTTTEAATKRKLTIGYKLFVIADVFVIIVSLVLLGLIASFTTWPAWKVLFCLAFLLNVICFMRKLVTPCGYVSE